MQLKFKIWDKLHKQFINNLVIGINNGEIASDRYEFLLYTGIKDNNGVELYENDIIKAKGGFYQIVYSNDMAVFEVISNCCLSGLINLSQLFHGGKIEKVGNIYENPKLLN